MKKILIIVLFIVLYAIIYNTLFGQSDEEYIKNNPDDWATRCMIEGREPVPPISEVIRPLILGLIFALLLFGPFGYIELLCLAIVLCGISNFIPYIYIIIGKPEEILAGYILGTVFFIIIWIFVKQFKDLNNAINND